MNVPIKKLVRLLFLLTLYTLPANLPATNKKPIDQKKFDAKMAEMNQKMAALANQQATLEAKFPELERALKQMIDQSDPAWLATFQDKLLFSIPIYKAPPVAIGFFGRDLVVFAFYALNILLDHTLYSNLHHYYVDHAIEAIMFNRKQIISCINQLSVSENGLIEHNDAYNKLQQLLSERCFPSPTFSLHELKRFVTAQLGYLLGSEGIAYLQHHVLPPEHGGFFGPFKQIMQELDYLGQRKDADGCYYIPFSIIVKQLLNTYLTRWEVVSTTWAENAPWIRNLLLRWADWYHPALNSYWFYLAKRSLILSRFFLQAHDAYRQALTGMLMVNIEEIKTILEMPDPQDNAPSQNKTNESATSPKQASKPASIRAEQLLKLLLIKQQQETFISWLQFKKECINWTDFEIEMLLLLPAWYKAGKLLYNLV